MKRIAISLAAALLVAPALAGETGFWRKVDVATSPQASKVEYDVVERYVTDFTFLSQKSNSSTTVTLGDGGSICGPFDVVGDSGGSKIEVFHLPPGQCIGGTYPDWHLSKPETGGTK